VFPSRTSGAKYSLTAPIF